MTPGGVPPAEPWRWRNYYYDTGPIFPEDPSLGIDELLSEPPSAWYIHGQKPPLPDRHSGYWVDPRVWDLVGTYAEELPRR